MKKFSSRILLAILLAFLLFSITVSSASAATSLSKQITGYADTNSNFKVYADRSTSSSKVGTAFSSSDEITIMKIYSDGWAKIKFPVSGGTKTGYCKTSKLLCKTSFSDSRVTATQDIKAYKKDDCASKYGTVYKGDKCYLIGNNGKNTQILYPVSNGDYKSAWLKGVYTNRSGVLQLKGSSSGSSSSSSSGKTVSVSLSVKRYSQTNSEWKNTYIGTKTIGQIGCTTTCMAMLYSYKKGKAYTPDQMVKKLDYSNNDLIWASVKDLGYKVKSCSSMGTQDMLKAIYEALEDGKPVMFGAKKGSKQHWVVVTGYKGSTSSFKASGFTINDPNSTSRQTLEAFLDYRPEPYKMVY